MFSISSISKIFKLFNFELIDAFPQITHGGSMRYVIKRKNADKISQNLKTLLELEKENKIDSIEACLKFKKNCELSKKKILEKLNKLKSDGKKISGYAATSKSTTILNYCQIDNGMIDFICDTTPEKIGKYSPGMHIPIISMNHFKKSDFDIAYLFAWNHKKEIFNNEKNFKKKGGIWISHTKL